MFLKKFNCRLDANSSCRGFFCFFFGFFFGGGGGHRKFSTAILNIIRPILLSSNSFPFNPNNRPSSNMIKKKTFDQNVLILMVVMKR